MAAKFIRLLVRPLQSVGTNVIYELLVILVDSNLNSVEFVLLINAIIANAASLHVDSNKRVEAGDAMS